MYHYGQNFKTRIKCDASHSGLGVALEQVIEKESLVPGFSTTKRRNVARGKWNYLPSFGLVSNSEINGWVLVLTEHKAIILAIKTNRGKETHQSRLTRWADRLLPFDFDALHISGSKLEKVD